MRGKLITFEGMDGSGKTTQLEYARELLEQNSRRILVTREPGGTPLGEKVRELLMNNQMIPMTELLLFMAARAQHVEEVIKPALAEGMIVLCDRFIDSTFAYQGSAMDLMPEVAKLNEMVLRGFEPDYTLYFSLPLTVSAQRLQQRRQSDRFDVQSAQMKFLKWKGFERQFKNNPHRMILIDANQPIGNVRNQVYDVVYDRIIPDMLAEKSFIQGE